MMHTVGLQVRAIAWTHFEPPADVPWATDVDGGQALAEFAGRACYQSWSKPNPATATNAGYLQHILEVGHLSVLEHGTVTMYLTGVSRSFTHELVRHRHFSYSQLSQRYVASGDTAVVEPDVIADDPYLHRLFTEAVEHAQRAYDELLHGLERKLAAEAAGPPWVACDDFTCPKAHRTGRGGIRQHQTTSGALTNATAIRKAGRQAARAVLPNATETRIVVTGNYRAWRHFITMRATAAADVEIRAGAIACLRELQRIAPNVFGDFAVELLDDGTEIASTKYGWE